MGKLTSETKMSGKTQMGSGLTEPEVDAALQLIQLSGESSSTDNFSVMINNNNIENTKGGIINGSFEEESVGNSTADHHEISSAVKNTMIEDESSDDDACPPRNRKYRSLLDIYMKTRPLIKKQLAAGKNRKARIIG